MTGVGIPLPLSSGQRKTDLAEETLQGLLFLGDYALAAAREFTPDTLPDSAAGQPVLLSGEP